MVLAFREALSADKAAYGLAAQAALAPDFPLRNALPEQSHDRLIAGHPALEFRRFLKQQRIQIVHMTWIRR